MCLLHDINPCLKVICNLQALLKESMTNTQIVTRWADKQKSRLTTSLEQNEIAELKPGEILVEVLAVPLHGSFWLASHPEALHPRIDEFMIDGRFVFGNGGVCRVLKANEDVRLVKEGDYVCAFGHVPCSHYDCYACTVLHRYAECEYNESTILGHGKHAGDGTYARYAVLPRYSYELCYRGDENPSEDDLMAFMFGFLFGDVRNALIRHPDSLRARRMLLFGAGFSGRIAAYLHNRTSPESRIVVVDSSEERLDSLKTLAADAVRTVLIPADVTEELTKRHQEVEHRHELQETITMIREAMLDHFGGRRCNLMFDASSGNTAPLWDNPDILGPATHCIPFGFGSRYVLLSSPLMQQSGLSIFMSRGVGNIRNRKEVIELIKAGASSFVHDFLIGPSKRYNSMEEVMQLISEQHDPPQPLHRVPPVYLCPNGEIS